MFKMVCKSWKIAYLIESVWQFIWLLQVALYYIINKK